MMQMMQSMKAFALLAAMAATILTAGCAKKVAKVTPPPPPSPAAGPAATVAANPSAVQQPQSTASATPAPTEEELFSRNVRDVFFDYDKYAIRVADAPTVENNETFLAQHPDIKVLVEGHCDDRGSEEYNIALGANRAESVKRALVQGGVPEERIRTVSFGKEKPFCTEDNDECWQQNRVDHFAFDR